MKTITVKHEVSPGRESCEFGGDFWGKEVCKYHTFRTQTHGRKAPPEYRKPKCLLFDCWLEQPYKKCEACKKACMEAEYDNQQWLDAPENKREAPGTTNRSFDPVPLGHEPFPKIERVDE